MKKEKNGCALSGCMFCNNTVKEWKPVIEANRKLINYHKNDLIFREGHAVEGMYFVTHGVVKVHKQWTPDKELILRFASQGDIFGHRGMGDESIFPVSATALEDTEVCFIPLEFFYSSLKVNPEFQYSMLMFFAAELKESERRMRDLAHMSVQGRVASALLRLENKFGLDEEGYIYFTPYRQDIAAYAGTTYETLFRTLTVFAHDRLIKTNGKKIGILNHATLQLFTTEN